MNASAENPAVDVDVSFPEGKALVEGIGNACKAPGQRQTGADGEGLCGGTRPGGAKQKQEREQERSYLSHPHPSLSDEILRNGFPAVSRVMVVAASAGRSR